MDDRAAKDEGGAFRPNPRFAQSYIRVAPKADARCRTQSAPPRPTADRSTGSMSQAL